jgi:hypothetical protein
VSLALEALEGVLCFPKVHCHHGMVAQDSALSMEAEGK